MNMNLPLPDSLKSWVEEQAALGGYPSPADYVHQLLRKEQKEQNQKLRDEIEQKLLQALDSGDPVDVTPEFWEARRQELMQRMARQGQSKGV